MRDPAQAVKAHFQPLITTGAAEEVWPGFSFDDFDVEVEDAERRDERIVRFTHHAMKSIPLATAETNFRPAIPSLSFRVRETEGDWQVVDVAPWRVVESESDLTREDI